MNGVLLFAIQEDVVNFSKPKVDYLKLAEHCALQVKKHMSLPVSLVTNTSFKSGPFDKIINVNLHSRQVKKICLLYTSPSPRDRTRSRMPSSA